MEAYRTNAVVHDDGTVLIENLPFEKGQRLEVILLEQPRASDDASKRTLHGEPVKYANPFDSVAEDDWENVN